MIVLVMGKVTPNMESMYDSLFMVLTYDTIC